MPKLTNTQSLKVNIDGKLLEKAGRISEAIALYEWALANGTDTPHTYSRLLVLYRKARRTGDERRVCELAERLWPVARDGYGNVSPSAFSVRLASINAKSQGGRGR